MPSIPPDVLSQAEHTLRQFDAILALLDGTEPDRETWQAIQTLLRGLTGREPGLAAIPNLLLSMHAEIRGALDGLRLGRTAIASGALTRLRDTSEKLQQVTSTTETATTTMLDGLDRALALLDAANVADLQPVREQIFDVIAQMQFQDITAQQIAHASAMLEDVETRLEGVLDSLSGLIPGDEHTPVEVIEETTGAHFDPAASMDDAESRQALADELFG